MANSFARVELSLRIGVATDRGVTAQYKGVIYVYRIEKNFLCCSAISRTADAPWYGSGSRE
jgi:hypothetical protein